MTWKPIKLEEPLECWSCGFIMLNHPQWVNGVCELCAEEEE